MRILKYISTSCFLLLLVILVYNNSPHYQIIKGEIFGTYYNIKIRSQSHDKGLKAAIINRLNEINMQMSVFEAGSEVNKINQAQSKEQIILSSDMRNVLKASYKVWNESRGYFDPTLGKIIDLWGFGPSKTSAPTDDAIKKAMRAVGFNKINLSNDFYKLTKTNSQTVLNLSAVAKGYAVDEIAELLNRKGYKNYVIEIGGEIKVRGFKSDPEIPWSVGINKPQNSSDDNSLILSLSNISVATSGNYRNFYQKDGRIYSHTISHKTGRPVASDILSVSVFHNSCMYADAYATAILAMGVDKGIKFADKNKLKVIIFDNKMNKIYSSSAQKAFTE